VIVEASAGQLEDEVRLALSRSAAPTPRLHSVRRMGGVLPQVQEIAAAVRRLEEVRA
jgi:hypothetical protein